MTKKTDYFSTSGWCQFFRRTLPDGTVVASDGGFRVVTGEIPVVLAHDTPDVSCNKKGIVTNTLYSRRHTLY